MVKNAKLDPAQKLAEREKKLAELQTKLSRERASIAEQKRKLDTRNKIELGGLVLKAGLAEWDRATLLGGLMAIARMAPDEEKLSRWKAEGGKAFNAGSDPALGNSPLVQNNDEDETSSQSGAAIRSVESAA